MSLVAEHILQGVITRGLVVMRQDSRFLDQLFRNLDRESQDQIRDFIRTRPIDVCLNYPRSDLKLPAIVILLRSETEAQPFLGDSMGAELPDDFTFDGALGTQIIGGRASSAAARSAEDKRTFGPYFATSGTANTIEIADPVFVTNEFAKAGMTVRIVGGTGVGQIRAIASNDRETITVTPGWLTVPDDTSVFEVRELGAEVVGGEPARLYDRRDATLWLERRGALYRLAYQIQVIAPASAALAVYLAIVVKAILTLARATLEKQGCLAMTIGMTDLTPRPEYVPDFAYMRSLNVEFLHPFDVYEEMADLASSFQLVLEGGTPLGDLSDTTGTVGLEAESVGGP